MEQFLPKHTMALVVTRLIYGISAKASDAYVKTLPQYKSLMRKAYVKLYREFVGIVAERHEDYLPLMS